MHAKTELDMRKWAVHERDTMRIVLEDYPETTIARTGCGMFSEAVNIEHSALIVRAVNRQPIEADLLAALKASLVEHEALREVMLLNPAMRGTKEPARKRGIASFTQK